MDDLSHILWSYLLFSWTGHPWLAILFGVLPDLISFVPMFVVGFRKRLLRPEFPKAYKKLPRWTRAWAEESYKWTHNIFSAGLVVLLAASAGAWWALAWVVHVLMDIPTHSKKFYPTPILWPLSDWSYDGTPWSDKRVMIPNAVALVVGYSILLW